MRQGRGKENHRVIKIGHLGPPGHNTAHHGTKKQLRIMSEKQKEKNTNSIKENETNQISTDKTSLKESELEAKAENL